MLALVVTVPAGEVELASDVLWSLGVLAVEERDGDPPTEDHLVELWTSLGDDVDDVTRAAEGFSQRWRWRLVEVDESVADTWRQHAQPAWVMRDLAVVPAWVSFEPQPTDARAIVLRIEPGSTFGLGDHPTTMLSLRALRDACFAGCTVLDVGTGSGVLAVAAATFGAVRVDAIDIAPQSPATVDANAARNGVTGIVAASTTPLAAIPEQYDVVVANILAPTLVELADDLRRVTAPGGVLIVSGVLDAAHDHVVAALAPMRVVARAVSDGWAALTLRW